MYSSFFLNTYRIIEFWELVPIATSEATPETHTQTGML